MYVGDTPTKKMMHERFPAYYEGSSGALAIDSPTSGVVVLTINGRDVGEFGSMPMQQLENYLPDTQAVELYIDARRSKGVSIEVSSEWALWLGANRSCFKGINMLTGSRFIQITAEFVRNFSDLQGIMRIYTDADAFDEALAASIAGTRND